MTDEQFARELSAIHTTLLREQEPLGEEFEGAYWENVDKLYQYSDEENERCPC